MDLHEQRMQCLKMAFDLGGKPDHILAAAQQLLDFVSGSERTAPENATSAEPAIAEASSAPEAAPDPIAACGTALVMPEDGELADAVPPATMETAEIVTETTAVAIETAEASAPEAEQAAVESSEAEPAPPEEAAIETSEMSATPAEDAPAEDAPADDAPAVEAPMIEPAHEIIPEATVEAESAPAMN